MRRHTIIGSVLTLALTTSAVGQVKEKTTTPTKPGPQKKAKPFPAFLALGNPTEQELFLGEGARRTFERLAPANEGRALTFGDLTEQTGLVVTGWQVAVRKIQPAAKGWIAEVDVSPKVHNPNGAAAFVFTRHTETWSYDGKRLKLLNQKPGRAPDEGFSFAIL
jgi:hypothetical protein